MSSDLPDYAVLARKHWTNANAKYTDARARESWARKDIKWGVFDNLESDIRILPEMQGLEVIELGCGTAYFGAWLKRAGAKRVVGVDITPAQLDTARRVNAETGLGLEFIEANAEDVPLPDSSFDIAFSEYGASIWCDANKWIPEAARLLRPGGELIFMRNSDIQMICSPDEERISEQLQRPLRGMNRLDWHDEGEPSAEFHLNHSDMFGLLRRTGFEVVDFRDLYAPDGAVDHPFYNYVPAEWARKWPAEEIWRARKRA